jgi:transposase
MKRKPEWVFGLYDRDTQKVLFVHVPDRKASTLLNIINKHCHPRSVIYSDCWAAYNRITRMQSFRHRTVNHSFTFCERGVHTNSIESVWNSGKVYTKQMRGINIKYLQSYLDEFC